MQLQRPPCFAHDTSVPVCARRLLSLSNNGLWGSLPGGWGAPGAFPRLQILRLASNYFSGPLPAPWAGPGAFPAMRSARNGVVLGPGNSNLTGPVPASTPFAVLQVLGQHAHAHDQINLHFPQNTSCNEFKACSGHLVSSGRSS